jgi:cyclic pyranopterin phosphate synthase
MTTKPKLVDSFGRTHNSLRVSVTDRCNIRCFYCMPAENVRFKPRTEILSFEEIARFVNVAATLGVNKIRLTGGEPLVRNDLPDLVAALRGIEGIEEIALTTNGMLLAEQAQPLKGAGLQRINISLDTLDEEIFEKISRRRGLDKVFQGIAAAQQQNFEKIRLNAIAIADLTESQIIPLAKFARQQNLELRFIEFMPLDSDQNWSNDKVLSGKKIRATIESEFGRLTPVPRTDPSQPATDFCYSDTNLCVGFINPVSQPFCGDCNRLRITAEGKIRNCLFSTVEWDARSLMRSGADDDEIRDLILDCVASKKAGHGIDSDEFIRPQRAMYQIGG